MLPVHKWCAAAVELSLLQRVAGITEDLCSSNSIVVCRRIEDLLKKLQVFRMAHSREECVKFFNDADTDGDGYLSYDEMSVMLKANGFKGTEKELKGFFEAADTSGDNLISLDEYLAVMGQVPESVTKEAMMRRVFRSFDKDGNGVIDRNEFKAIFDEMGRDLSEDELKRSMTMIDTNADGRIDYEEFIAYFFGSK